GERPEDANADDDDAGTKDAPFVRDRELVAVTYRRDGHYDIPNRIRGGGDVGIRGGLLQGEYPQRPELEHQKAHETQAKKRASGAVAQQPVADDTDAVRAQQAEHSPQAEYSEHLELQQRKAG